VVRPAWAHSCGCKSHRELVTASEVMSNGRRVTDLVGKRGAKRTAPVAATVLPVEMDQEPARWGPSRYADDRKSRVQSRRAGERMMALLWRLDGRSHLTVNETSSAVVCVFARRFPGHASGWRRGR
jgi:retron-type reverse transcriptase